MYFFKTVRLYKEIFAGAAMRSFERYYVIVYISDECIIWTTWVVNGRESFF